MLKASTLAILTVLAMGSRAEATVIIPGSAAAQGAASGVGLSGEYRKAANGSTNFTIASTLTAMNATPVSGTFTATSLSYNGGDMSTITSFLGSDGSSYTGRAAAAGDLSDAILKLSGYLYVAAPGTYTFTLQHDDSAQLTIGNQTIISRDCCGTDSNDASFSVAGYYALSTIYSNSTYNGGTGGATFSLAENGATLTSANLVKVVVPEPPSLALLGMAVGGFVFLRTRRGRGPLGSEN